MLRFGLCCIFRDQPIRFVTTTATSIARLPCAERLAKLSRLCHTNAEALHASLEFCVSNGIGCFRINSQILPLKTHPQFGYDLVDLPAGDEIEQLYCKCGTFAACLTFGTCFHPDQFVVLNSPRREVVTASVAELQYQSEVADWVGADVLNVHAGGSYGDKSKALSDFARNLARLSPAARERLTVENDDKIYAPADLLPLCKAEGLPLVYDVHHHRCHGDGMSEAEVTKKAIATWNREPLFHISSPQQGWKGSRPERHRDYIDPNDFPDCWLGPNLTVEVEAKAKELAVLELMRAFHA